MRVVRLQAFSRWAIATMALDETAGLQATIGTARRAAPIPAQSLDVSGGNSWSPISRPPQVSSQPFSSAFAMEARYLPALFGDVHLVVANAGRGVSPTVFHLPPLNRWILTVISARHAMNPSPTLTRPFAVR
jgi:hypothetical protein